LEKPKETAEVISPWLLVQLRRWEEAVNENRGDYWTKKVNPIWMEKMSKM